MSSKPLNPKQIEFLSWYCSTYPKSIHVPMVAQTLKRGGTLYHDRDKLNLIRDFHLSKYRNRK